MMEILRILNASQEIMGAKAISEELNKRGYILGERAVRYHMRILDEKGYTERIGYAGRKITKDGIEELTKGLIYDQVDFTYSRFEEKMYGVTLDPKTGKGSVIVNISSINDLKAENIIKDVFQEGLSVSPNIDIVHKDNKIYVETVCGTTIDGVFQKSGIITQPLCGGLIEVEDNVPIRFVEQISYKQTSLTPLEAFTGEGNTSVLNIIHNGSGLVPANFRIIPAAKREQALSILKDLKKIGIDGVIKVGESGKSVLGVPVPEDMVGIAIIGGVAPLCAAQEAGFDMDIKLADNFADYERMIISKNKPDIKLKTPSEEKQDKITFVLNKAYNLMSNVTFDPETFTGDVLTNISYVKKDKLNQSIEILNEVYKKKPAYCVGNRYAILEGFDDYVGIATICSLTVDAILTGKGIQAMPLYSGILDVDNNIRRFIELISYTGSSVDPHEIFIKKDMHNVYGALKNSGQILANVHTIPYVSRDQTINILNQIKQTGFEVLSVGQPNEYVYNAKVEMYHFGFVTSGGLNPIVAIKEKGIPVKVKTIERLMDYNSFEEF